MSQTSIDGRTLRNAAGTFATGITVVTTRAGQGDDARDHGMTANAFSSLSLDPPLVLVCVGHKAHAHDLLKAAGSFAVNILSADQEELSDRFAHRIKTADGYTGWPNDRDKFEDLSFSRSEHTGAALLDGCLTTLDCQLHEVLPGGDHSIFVGRVVAIGEGTGEQAGPLLFHKGRYARLGG